MEEHQMQEITSTEKIRRNIIKNLKSIPCTILKHGYKKITEEYIFCSCDPDLQDPICLECYSNCHKDHSILGKKKLNAICSCGSKSHKSENQNKIEKNLENNSCSMMEWNYLSKLNYYHAVNNNKIICIFCYNFCEENHEEISIKKFDENLNKNISCQCTNNSHSDYMVICKKLRNTESFGNCNFEGLSRTHFLNLIVKSEESFENIFHDFNPLFTNLEKKLRVLQDDSHKISRTLTLTKMTITENNISRNLNFFLEILTSLSRKLKRMNYIDKKFSKIFNKDLIISLMNIPSDYKYPNVWTFKLNLFTNFVNFTFKRHFAIAPNLSISDLELLSPFQRLFYISNIKSDEKISRNYVNNLKHDFLENLLNALNLINSTKEKFSVSYVLKKRIINICKNYAKFGLLNYAQALKFFTILDDIFIKLAVSMKNFSQEYSMKDEILREKIYLIKPIIKSLIYLNYNYNDQVIEKYLKSPENFKPKFFSSILELTKFSSKNLINYLTDLLNNPKNELMKKELKENISNSFSLLNNFIHTKDNYSSGLKRLLHNNNQIYFKFLSEELKFEHKNFVLELRNSTSKIESDYYLFYNFEITEENLVNNLISEIKKIFKNMNIPNYKKGYLNTLQMYTNFPEEENPENYLNYIVVPLNNNPKINNVIDNNNINVNNNENNHSSNKINKEKYEEKNLNSTEGKKILSDKNNNNLNAKNNYNAIATYKILMNKSFIIFNIIKVIKILYTKNIHEINTEKVYTKKERNKISDDFLGIKKFKDSKNLIKNINFQKINNEKNEKKSLDFEINEKLFEEILKLITFYIDENENNSLILLSSDFTYSFSLLNGKQLSEIIGIIYIAMKNLIKVKFELANFTNLLKFLKNILKKISLDENCFKKNARIFIKILKILKIISKLNFMDDSIIVQKMRKFIFSLFNRYEIIKNFIFYLNNFSNEKKEEEIKEEEKENLNLNLNKKNENFEEEEINFKKKNLEKFDEIKENDNLNFQENENEDNNDLDFNGNNFIYLSNILYNFLNLINIFFDGNLNEYNKQLLSEILNPLQIKNILLNKKIDLNLRKEILVYYHILYINVNFQKDKINDYLNLIIDKKVVKNSQSTKLNIFQTFDCYTFYHDLIKFYQTDSDLTIEYEIIINEIKIQEEILKNKEFKDITKFTYLIKGIIILMKTHISKFLSKKRLFNGNDLLRLYELIVQFLFLKYKIITNQDYLDLLKKRPIYKDFFEISNLKNVEYFIPIVNFYNEKSKAELKKDIEYLQNPQFEFYREEILINIFNKHLNNFIIQNNQPSIVNLFKKKNEEFDEDAKTLLLKKLEDMNYLKEPYEICVYNLIINYFNAKRNLTETGFINTLEDNNLLFSNSYRFYIVKSVFELIKDPRFFEAYSSQCFLIIFKLIQYDTKMVQREIIKLMEEKNSVIDLPNLIFIFLEKFVLILLNFLNTSYTNLNNDYFIGVNIIKILKYLCEDHNKEFQKIFFKEINLFSYEEKLTKINNQNIKRGKEKENSENKKENSDNENKKEDLEKEIIGARRMSKAINSKMLLEEDEENLEFLCVFELMLEIVKKIILISNWTNMGFNEIDDDENDINVNYFYDIFNVVIEFLIEMIQGTEKGNLESLVFKKSKNKRLQEDSDIRIIIFFSAVKPLLLKDDCNIITYYQVRKDLIDLICAFLEEKSTPIALIKIIYGIFNPNLIFLSVVNTLKKLYFRLENREDKFNSYKQIKFDKNIFLYFKTQFFSDSSFAENPEFELANRMYQYLKILATEYLNPDAIDIMNIENLKNFKEEENEKDIERKNLVSINTNKNKKEIKKNLEKNTENSDDDFYYITLEEKCNCVKFFEKITRIVMVQKENDLFRVVFTKNPLMTYLSRNTKDDFFLNVNRETRYIKLFLLMENSDYFFDEILYNSKIIGSNFLLRFLNKINYLILEMVAFIFSILTNFFMIYSLDKENEHKEGDSELAWLIYSLPLINAIFCGFVSFSWFYSKFPLYLKIDSKRLALKLKVKIEELNLGHKIKIWFRCIILRNEVLAFLWHIAFCLCGIIDHQYNFLFSVEILIIINLSSMLQNIIKSITLRINQLSVTFLLFLIFNYLFGVLAFTFFAADFYTNFKIVDYGLEKIGEPYNDMEIAQNQCGTIFYCFITHLDYGLRSDGGIGEYIPKRSYNLDKNYYLGRFFYQILYFIIVNIVIFSILMGIIIDTFTELREKTSDKEEDMKNVCYICGEKREILEKNSINFNQHTKKDHNLETYIEYMIFLKFLDPQETNATNSYAIEMIENKAISWFPYSSINDGENNE